MTGATTDCEVEDERLVTSVTRSQTVGKCVLKNTTLQDASSDVVGGRINDLAQLTVPCS